jgi:hypothetical protein
MNIPLVWAGMTALTALFLGGLPIPGIADRAAPPLWETPDLSTPDSPEQTGPDPALPEPAAPAEPVEGAPEAAPVEAAPESAAPEAPMPKSPALESAKPAETPPPELGLLWTGSWERGGNLTNRADLKLRLGGPDLTLRAQALDRRPGNFETLFQRFPWEVEEALSRLQGGLYHGATGSRILYGPLDEWGLAARLRNPWARGLPFTESRKSSTAELRNSPSTKEPELYLYLGTPFLKVPGRGDAGGAELRASASIRLNPAGLAEQAAEGGALEAPPGLPLGAGTALGLALEGRLGKDLSLSLEGFYTAASLPARESSGWFSEKPPLPPRNFSLYGLGLLFNTSWFSLSGDLAWSRTTILGRDLYGNLGIRAGNRGSGGASRPGGEWQLSLALDGAGRNYSGGDGQNPGPGFRAGGKFEWRQNRVGLFRIGSALSGPGISRKGEGELDLRFNRSSSSLSYRPPASALPLRLSRISLGAERNAGEAGLRDSAALDLGLALNPQAIAGALGRKAPAETGFPRGILSLGFSASLAGSPGRDWDPEKGGPEPSPWPLPGGPYRFEALKAGGEIVWSLPLNLGGGVLGLGPGRGNLRLRAGLDYSLSAPTGEDETARESRSFSLHAALSGGRGRYSLSLSRPDFPWGAQSPPAPWDLSLSWKREW